MVSTACPCGSVKTYLRCCGPYHTGLGMPRTARQLMRSRYSAYALGSLGQYLIDTWHPSARTGLDAAELSELSQSWLGLIIVDASQNGDTAEVEFKASFEDSDGSHQTHHEISTFSRIDGQWFYLDGKTPTTP
ncbi:MAG: SEC-C motif-containing protein [Pseudohongiellaceae bacterium]|jgi:SEC-C motif-containing protein